MDEREMQGGTMGDAELGAQTGRSAAGAANTPSFERGAMGASAASEGGRPPSHRELEEGTIGGTSEQSGQGGQGGGGAAAQAEDVARRANQQAGEALDRAAHRLEEGKDRAASGLESASRKLHETADRQGTSGVRGTAGRLAHEVAGTGERAAEYLRDADLEDLRGSIERQVRDKPLQTLLIAAAAGWLIGKIVR